MDDRKLTALMTGKSFSYAVKDVPPSAAPVVLQIEKLSRGGEYVDVSFEVRAGEILGITGLLGSGRTELALSLFGMTRPDSGAILVNGKRVSLSAPREAIDLGIAYVPEDRLTQGLVLDQPISSNIVVTILEKLAGRFGLVDPQLRRRAAEACIGELSIKVSDPENAVKTLSGGNQQRVVLGKWIARRPRLLILDSPTVGVDVSAKDGIYEIVRRLAQEGIAIIMISDEVPEVLYHCHRVLVMRSGRITGDHLPYRSSERELMEAVNA
jgi:simple sugar transport system ATP-binding protein